MDAMYVDVICDSTLITAHCCLDHFLLSSFNFHGQRLTYSWSPITVFLAHDVLFMDVSTATGEYFSSQFTQTEIPKES